MTRNRHKLVEVFKFLLIYLFYKIFYFRRFCPDLFGTRDITLKKTYFGKMSVTQEFFNISFEKN